MDGLDCQVLEVDLTGGAHRHLSVEGLFYPPVRGLGACRLFFYHLYGLYPVSHRPCPVGGPAGLREILGIGPPYLQ